MFKYFFPFYLYFSIFSYVLDQSWSLYFIKPLIFLSIIYIRKYLGEGVLISILVIPLPCVSFSFQIHLEIFYLYFFIGNDFFLSISILFVFCVFLLCISNLSKISTFSVSILIFVSYVAANVWVTLSQTWWNGTSEFIWNGRQVVQGKLRPFSKRYLVRPPDGSKWPKNPWKEVCESSNIFKINLAPWNWKSALLPLQWTTKAKFWHVLKSVTNPSALGEVHSFDIAGSTARFSSRELLLVLFSAAT